MRYNLPLLLLPCLLFISSISYATQTILVIGDSLSSAHGIPYQNNWVSLMEQRLISENFIYKTINASISGQTSSNPLSHIDKLLHTHKPSIVIIGLGANDGLRGLTLAHTEYNLNFLISQCRGKNIDVLLLGFKLPPNYGEYYSNEFATIYTKLANLHQIPFVPFLLEGFALDFDYFQSDGLHPNEAAQPLMLDNVWPHLKPILKHK